MFAAKVNVNLHNLMQVLDWMAEVKFHYGACNQTFKMCLSKFLINFINNFTIKNNVHVKC